MKVSKKQIKYQNINDKDWGHVIVGEEVVDAENPPQVIEVDKKEYKVRRVERVRHRHRTGSVNERIQGDSVRVFVQSSTEVKETPPVTPLKGGEPTRKAKTKPEQDAKDHKGKDHQDTDADQQA